MSEIKVNRSEVDEERFHAYLDQKQLEALIAEAVAKAAGVNLNKKGVYVKTVYLTSNSGSNGIKHEARCEIVVDRRPQDEVNEEAK